MRSAEFGHNSKRRFFRHHTQSSAFPFSYSSVLFSPYIVYLLCLHLYLFFFPLFLSVVPSSWIFLKSNTNISATFKTNISVLRVFCCCCWAFNFHMIWISVSLFLLTCGRVGTVWIYEVRHIGRCWTQIGTYTYTFCISSELNIMPPLNHKLGLTLKKDGISL